MAGLCAIYGTRSQAPAPAALLAALGEGWAVASDQGPASAATEGASDWRRLVLRGPAGELSLMRLEAGEPGFPEQVRALTGLVLRAGEGQPGWTYRLLEKVTGAWHVVGVASPGEAPPFEGANRAAVSAIAAALYGIVLREARLLDPQLRVLLGPGGERDPDAELSAPAAARERRARTAHVLRASLNLTLPDELPLLPAEDEVRLRPAPDVAGRAQVLWALAERGPTLGREEVVRLLQERGLWEATTPREQEQLLEQEEEGAEERAHERAGHGAVAAWTLLWALGRAERLDAPGAPEDLQRLSDVLRHTPAAEFAASARLRPASEVLDAADLSYAQHWALANAERGGAPPPARANPVVIRERHLALFWLIQHMRQGWDQLASEG